jgi:SAM-dependent methyltransferase
MAHDHPQPSDWVKRWSRLIPTEGCVLDLACGQGRHMRWLSSLGLQVLGVDRDPTALALARAWGETLHADLEGDGWPLVGRLFSGVVVTHYLWRPTLPSLLANLDSGGVLIYETFSRDQARIGKPSRDDFLLRPGELLDICSGLRVVAYEDGFLTGPERFIQRIVAIREKSPPGSTPRYPLSLE